ncbi:MAG: 2-dehydropantoate 2-reductase [Chlorobiaceae bacterium]|nr:2-dehydropantoate 2-reductase [Chlorobiaceae bacterium]
MRIAIIGTGGVGGYLGAKLWKADNEVIFVARGNHLASLQHNGLLLESPEGNFTVRSIFTDTLNNLPPFDLIIIAVKSFDTKAAANLAMPVLKNDTIVISIQNGVENEDILARALGNQHVLGGVAYIFSTIAAPGVIRHEGGTGKFKFGEMDGTISNRCLKLNEIFQKAEINSEPIENVRRLLWDKWIFICGLGGMTAYTRKPIGEIISEPSLKTMLNEVTQEAAMIARAKKIDSFEGIEAKTIKHFERLPFRTTSSMYYDITHGKRIELDALNGAIVRFGKELNILTPANEIIYNSLKEFAQSIS